MLPLIIVSSNRAVKGAAGFQALVAACSPGRVTPWDQVARARESTASASVSSSSRVVKKATETLTPSKRRPMGRVMMFHLARNA